MQEHHQNTLRELSLWLSQVQFADSHDRLVAERYAEQVRGIVDAEGAPTQALTVTFVDEIDAVFTGNQVLATIPVEDGGRLDMTDNDPAEPAIPRIRAVARFDAQDRLRAAYLLSRDMLNRTQLTMLAPAKGMAALPDLPATAPISQDDAKLLNDFFFKLTHYDFCGDNPADHRAAMQAWAIASRLVRQAGPEGDDYIDTVVVPRLYELFDPKLPRPLPASSIEYLRKLLAPLKAAA